LLGRLLAAAFEKRVVERLEGSVVQGILCDREGAEIDVPVQNVGKNQRTSSKENRKEREKDRDNNNIKKRAKEEKLGR
jgi:hypothetical protein